MGATEPSREFQHALPEAIETVETGFHWRTSLRSRASTQDERAERLSRTAREVARATVRHLVEQAGALAATVLRDGRALALAGAEARHVRWLLREVGREVAPPCPPNDLAEQVLEDQLLLGCQLEDTTLWVLLSLEDAHPMRARLRFLQRRAGSPSKRAEQALIATLRRELAATGASEQCVEDLLLPLPGRLDTWCATVEQLAARVPSWQRAELRATAHEAYLEYREAVDDEQGRDLELCRQVVTASANLLARASSGQASAPTYTQLGEALQVLATRSRTVDREIEALRSHLARWQPRAQRLNRGDIGFAQRMRATGAVSGDFVVCHALDERRTLVVVGDAIGHGLGAAVIATAATASILTGLRTRRPSGPEEVLAWLDPIVYEMAGDGMATGVASIVDVKAGTIATACAGHAPPLVVSPSWTPGARPTIGPSLGATGCRRDVSLSPLPRAVRLAWFTDGVTEQTDAMGRLFGERRLAAALAAPVPDASALGDLVVTRLTEHGVGNVTLDDWSLVVAVVP